MRYQIIGLPAPFSMAIDLVVVDCAGNFGLVACHPYRFTSLTRSDAAAIMGFYDAAQNTGWWTLDELAHRLSEDPPNGVLVGGSESGSVPAGERSDESPKGRYRPAASRTHRRPTATEYPRRARRFAPSIPHYLLYPIPSASEAGYPTRLSPYSYRQGLRRRQTRAADPRALPDMNGARFPDPEEQNE